MHSEGEAKPFSSDEDNGGRISSGRKPRAKESVTQRYLAQRRPWITRITFNMVFRDRPGCHGTRERPLSKNGG